MSADQEVDDSFISIRIRNVGGKVNVLFHVRGTGCLERVTWGLLCYPVYYRPIMLFCGLLAFEILLVLTI